MIESVLIAMSNPMNLWYVIVGALLLVLLFHSIKSAHHERRTRAHGVHALDVARERDLFYIPGDIKYDDKDGDFDDL